MNKVQQQVISLAGLFQAMSAVHDIAQSGSCQQEELETTLFSLFEMNPESTLSVYGNDVRKLQKGLTITLALLEKSETQSLRYVIRYALAILHLERKLNKSPNMLEEVGKRLSRMDTQREHFGLTHENTISNIASVYLDTISTFQLRLQISGHERYLTVDLNAAKIRALLLGGIRSAMLWRQLGGHRWHFIFKRRALVKECKTLLNESAKKID